MKWWRSSRDLLDEVDHFYEEAVADLIAQGLSEEDARRRARMQFGSTVVVRERVRGSGWEDGIETLIADLAYACRRMRRDRAFTAVGVLTLALGIGAATAIFSVVYPILFARLPYPHPDRVAVIWDATRDGARLDVTFGTYRELMARARSLETLAVMRTWQPTIIGEADPERLEGQRVSATFFQALGISPLLGRAFDANDDRPNGARVVVLSHELWRRRFAGDPAIVGRAIVLEDLDYAVVGVMPARFENVLAPSAVIWAPLQYDPTLPPDGREWGHHLRTVARLAPGVDVSSARRELLVIAAQPIADFARPQWAAMANGVTITSLQEDITRGVKPALIAVLGAVAMLLTIACVNVTNLLLTRGTQRRGELAMRTALGAGRGRLMRQLLTESMLLAACGGALGICLAVVTVRWLVSVSPSALPRLDAIAIDRTVLLAALGLTTAVGVVVGVIPAMHASRDLQSSVQRTSHRLAGGHRLTRRTLVVVEVALALVLLVGAGLLLRSVERLLAIAPGFASANRLVMQVQTAGRRLADDTATHTFFAQSLDAVRAVPGVWSAGFTSQLPLSGDFDKYGLRFEVGTYGNDESGVFRYAVVGDYFRTLRIPLRHGRLLDARDTAASLPAAVISEAIARRHFAGRDPIGRRVTLGDPSRPPFTIVGVAGDVTQTSLATDRFDAVYVPAAQWPYVDRSLWLVLHTRGDAAALAPAVRAAVRSVDKDQPIARVTTLTEIVEASEADRRFAMMLFEVFAAVALMLAAIGLYGVLFAGVSERTREIGVRAALGASRLTIVRDIVREGMTLTAVGIVIGLAGASAASSVMLTLLFGVSRLDTATYAAVTVVLFGVSALACAIPAWRAAWIDPALTLRSE